MSPNYMGSCIILTTCLSWCIGGCSQLSRLKDLSQSLRPGSGCQLVRVARIDEVSAQDKWAMKSMKLVIPSRFYFMKKLIFWNWQEVDFAETWLGWLTAARLTTLIILGKIHFLLISENEFFHEIKRDGITWRNYNFAWNSCLKAFSRSIHHQVYFNWMPFFGTLISETFLFWNVIAIKKLLSGREQIQLTNWLVKQKKKAVITIFCQRWSFAWWVGIRKYSFED